MKPGIQMHKDLCKKLDILRENYKDIPRGLDGMKVVELQTLHDKYHKLEKRDILFENFEILRGNYNIECEAYMSSVSIDDIHSKYQISMPSKDELELMDISTLKSEYEKYNILSKKRIFDTLGFNVEKLVEWIPLMKEILKS